MEELETRMEIAEYMLRRAREELEQGDPVQASEKLYKAVEECIKVLACLEDLEECRREAGGLGCYPGPREASSETRYRPHPRGLGGGLRPPRPRVPRARARRGRGETRSTGSREAAGLHQGETRSQDQAPEKQLHIKRRQQLAPAPVQCVAVVVRLPRPRPRPQQEPTPDIS